MKPVRPTSPISFDRMVFASALGLLLIWILYCVASGRGPIPDAEITRAVQQAIHADGAVTGHSVSISTARRVVTLTGTVDNIWFRKRAIALASDIDGVRGVIGRLEVIPEVRNDEILRHDIRTALAEDPSTHALAIETQVISGTVVLTGTAGTYADKLLAGEVAESVRGVRQVLNEIQVSEQGTAHDEDLRERLVRRLVLRSELARARIEIAVDRGKVSLAGHVEKVSQRTLAADIAWMPGVVSVDVSRLRVAGSELPAERLAWATDESIRAVIHDVLQADPRVRSSLVHVAASDGAVALTGIVDNYRAKIAAEENARTVRGVWLVKNRLVVRPADRQSDPRLQDQLAQAIARDPLLSAGQVEVDAMDGVAYLRGTVSNRLLARRAEVTASRVRAVRDIVNDLVLASHGENVPSQQVATSQPGKEDVRSVAIASPGTETAPAPQDSPRAANTGI